MGFSLSLKGEESARRDMSKTNYIVSYQTFVLTGLIFADQDKVLQKTDQIDY
jgi:hypothetical protein